MKVKKRFLIAFLLLLLAAAAFLWRIAPEANGYTAKYLCSHVYTSGLDMRDGFDRYVRPVHFLFSLVVPEVDTAHREVTARLFGFLRPRTAVWREGCGCTLLVDQTAEELRSRHDLPHRLMRGDTLYPADAMWPVGNIVGRDSIKENIDWAAIDKLLDEAMREDSDEPAESNNTLALAIAWKGHIIGERYAKGVNGNTPLASWSATKSVTGALTGVMVRENGLDIHTPIGLPEWAGDVRKDITVDHLLRMESGLDFDEDYAPMADATKMLYESGDMGAFAAARPPRAGPGERWAYSSGTTNLLADILYARCGGTPEAMHRLAYDRFFNRLGITTAVFEHDESDAFVGSSYLYMSARDWLRVCKLFMDDGVWQGDRILPEGWVQYSLTPTSHATDQCYGAQVWLNALPGAPEGRLPSLPSDAFQFRGFQGQWVVGIPSKDLMLVRLGVTNHKKGWSPDEVMAGVMEALEGK